MGQGRELGLSHRVTAIGSDAASALHQPLSTTSYEEGPVYATMKANYTGSGGNTCEYGYRFDREGNVYVISGGQAGTTAVATVPSCSSIPAGKAGSIRKT